MSFNGKNIYELLPAIYRIRDAEQGEPLKALVEIIAREAKVTEEDIAGLYANWFIETCEEWVVPYIGDLLGVRGLNNIDDSATVSQRAYVANTMSYRRRKGIAPVLEQLALDVAGWRAHVVEFFELLGATQYMNHIRLHRPVTPDLRHMNQLDLLDTAFDSIAHSIDVRHISSGRGRHNISNIGLFIWRLQSYPLLRCDSPKFICSSDPSLHFFTFNPIGYNSQLFNRPQTETSITHLSNEINVPALLRRRVLYDELEARRQAIADEKTPVSNWFYDKEDLSEDEDIDTARRSVFEIFVDNSIIHPREIVICNLENCCVPPSEKKYKKLKDDGTYEEIIMPIKAAVDPVMGRFALTHPELVLKQAESNYSYGFSGDVGGGPYNREDSIPVIFRGKNIWQVGVSQNIGSEGAELIFDTIKKAIDAWNMQPPETIGVITIMDNHSYSDDLDIIIKEKSKLLVVAAGWPIREVPDTLPVEKIRLNGDIAASSLRPHVSGNINITGKVIATGGADDLQAQTGGEIMLNGLLVEGKLTILKGNLGTLSISHCTLVPAMGGVEAGADTLDPLSNQWLSINLSRSICGPVILNKTIAISLKTEDCVLDHPDNWVIEAGNIPVQLEKTTVFGKVSAKTIEAGNCIFNDVVVVERRQTGCIRFSYVLPVNAETPPVESKTPRRFRCQPDLEITSQIDEVEKRGFVSDAKKKRIKDSILGWLVPGFTSMDYGHHAYAQLNNNCPLQISTGGDNGSEMGVFNFLRQPQRRANLDIALDEYLPLGLEAGVIYIT